MNLFKLVHVEHDQLVKHVKTNSLYAFLPSFSTNFAEKLHF